MSSASKPHGFYDCTDEESVLDVDGDTLRTSLKKYDIAREAHFIALFNRLKHLLAFKAGEGHDWAVLGVLVKRNGALAFTESDLVYVDRFCKWVCRTKKMTAHRLTSKNLPEDHKNSDLPDNSLYVLFSWK